MKRCFALVPLFLFIASCSSGGGSRSTSIPGHGAIAIAVAPNPIVARRAGGNTYDFPFDVVVRETGGRSVSITRIAADVTALGGIPIASESYDAARIGALGYPTSVAANDEIHIHFNPRQSVADERLFSTISARLTVDGIDDGGSTTSATTTVTVRR